MKNGILQRVSGIAVMVLGLVATSGMAHATDPADAQERLVVREKLTLGPGFLDPISYRGHDSFGGHCIIWNDVAYLMAPSVSPLQVESFVGGLPPLETRRYQFHPFRYWSSTATNGSVSLPGQRITLTWSFVPDGTQILRPSGGGSLPSTLYSTMTPLFGTQDAWQSRFRQGFTDIGNLIGVNYIEVSDDGAAQPALGELGVRGDIRIAMIEIDGSGGTLAFNYFPSASGSGGDMVLDSGDAGFFRSSAGSFRNLRNTVMHEHGHGLGIAHVDPLNNTKLMEAALGTAFTGLQEDDIRGFQHAYGDRLEVNSSPETATVLDPLPTTPEDPPLVFQDLAIEMGTAVDYFRFTAPAHMGINIRVEPVGTSYFQGPQGGSVTFISANSVHDLAIDVMTGDAQETLQTINDTLAGSAEEGFVPLPAEGGEFLFRISAVTTSIQSQRYRLIVSLTPVTPPANPAETFSIF